MISDDEQNFYKAAIAFFNKYQDQTQQIIELSARLEKLEKFKEKIEKLPYYTEWVAEYDLNAYYE